MQDINLLPHEVRILEKKAKTAKYLKLTGIGVLSLAVIFLLISLVMFVSAQSKLSSISQKIKTVTSDLAANKDLEDALAILAVKSKELSQIMKTRPLYSKLLDNLSLKVPSDVRISEINVLSPTKVGVSGDSLGYLSLAEFLKAISNDKSGIFEGAVLNSVVLNSQTGRVQYVLEIMVKEGALL